MSTDRSHSAVRNLRTIFETKSNDSVLESRGRSPNGLGSDKENSRPQSKIRASFVAVAPSERVMAEEAAAEGMAELKPTTSADLRRDGFSEQDGDGQPVTEVVEQVRQALIENAKKVIPESVVESFSSTPLAENKTPEAAKNPDTAQLDGKPAENPDKATTGAEEELLELKPADPSSEDVMSGGEALSGMVEDLKSATSKTNGSKGSVKPSSISTKAPTKPATSSLKSPASQPKTPATKTEPSKLTTKMPSRKPSRSSLVAPTSASVARAAAAIEKTLGTPSNIYSAPAKPKAKDVTKPLDISARLTAPTAASRARHEQTSGSTSENSSIPTHLKTTPSTRSTPRSSLSGGQRPASRVSLGASSRKPIPPPDGSFLERMTRPTAASQNRAQEKVELRSPQRPASKSAASLKPQSGRNTQGSRLSTVGPPEADNNEMTTVDESALLEQAVVETNGLAEETKEAIAPTFDPTTDTEATPAKIENGNETPLSHAEAEAERTNLEATPAFKDEETIR